MSLEGGFSWFVLIPIIAFSIIIYGIYSVDLYIKFIALLISLMYGLTECYKWRWLD